MDPVPCLLCGNAYAELVNGEIARRWCDCGHIGAAPADIKPVDWAKIQRESRACGGIR